MSDPTTPAYEPTGPGASPEPSEEGARHGTLARLGLAFASPGEVFEDILRKPTWVLALVLLTLLGVGARLVAIPHVDVEQTIRARMEAQGRQISEEQMDAIMEQAGKFAYVGPVIAAVIIPVIMAIVAAVFFLGLKLTGSETDYARVFSASLHSFWPASLVGSVLFGVLVQRVGKLPEKELTHLVKSNVGAFLGSNVPAAARAVADSVDLFNIWIVVLLVLGLSTVGKVSRAKAAAVVIVPWVVYIAGKAVLAGFFG